MAAVLTRDIPGVLSVFEMQGSPIFSLWENNKDILFSFVGENEQERRDKLTEYLNLIKQSASHQQFTIKFHDEANKNGKVTNGTPVTGSLVFKLNENDDLQLVPKNQARVEGTNGSIALLNQIFDAKLQNMELRYNHILEKKQEEVEHLQEQLDRAGEEEEDTDDDDQMGLIGSIGKAGERYPWMQEHIKDIMTVAKSFLNKKFGIGEPDGARLAGVEDTSGMEPKEKLNKSIKELLEYYHTKYGDPKAGDANFANDIERLAKMAKTDPDLFDVMIKKLRNAAD